MGAWAEISSGIKFLDVAAGGSMLPGMLFCYQVWCYVTRYVVLLPGMLLCYQVCCYGGGGT